MKIIIIIIITILLTNSCNWNNKKVDCNKFNADLQYLKQYSLDGDKMYNTMEIEKKINFLEIESGIKNKDQGNLLGKFIVTSEDILHWEEWFDKECGTNSKLANRR